MSFVSLADPTVGIGDAGDYSYGVPKTGVALASLFAQPLLPEWQSGGPGGMPFWTQGGIYDPVSAQSSLATGAAAGGFTPDAGSTAVNTTGANGNAVTTSVDQPSAVSGTVTVQAKTEVNLKTGTATQTETITVEFHVSQTAFNQMLSAVGTAFSAIGSFISNVASTIGAWVQSTYTSVTKWWQGLWGHQNVVQPADDHHAYGVTTNPNHFSSSNDRMYSLGNNTSPSFSASLDHAMGGHGAASW